MAAPQIPAPTQPVAAPAAPQPSSAPVPGPRRSNRLSVVPTVVYHTPRTRGRFYIYEIYDRDAADEEWYWVRWFGYTARDDTAQHRDRLVQDGFGDLCDYVDAFKTWQAEAPGETRTFRQFKQIQRIPRTFTADVDSRCYVAAVRAAADLLGLVDYMPDVLLERFFQRYPGTSRGGVTWQTLTRLLQLANSVQRRAKAPGITFGGNRSKTNLIRTTQSGALDWATMGLQPGVYLCGVATAVAGHMFVLRATKTSLILIDSAEDEPQLVQNADFGWVVRWMFIRRCHLGLF